EREKISTELPRHNEAFASTAAAEEFLVDINLFDDDKEGIFKQQLEALGIVIGKYDPELRSYRAAVSPGMTDRIIQQDFVLFVERILPEELRHDQSMPLIGADYIRPGNPGTPFDGSSITLGILDSGFMLGEGAVIMHQDLDKHGCGRDFTDDGRGVWSDDGEKGDATLFFGLWTN
ncbi:MAG: serine protease, partial [Gammaproteobacteria bacterium]|nr:serine protease [Gammaproteobacteria bacterium]